MTIKAFLKKLATEREKAQKKQAADKAAASPAAAQPSGISESPSSAISNTANAIKPIGDDDAAQASREASSMPPSAEYAKPMTNGETLPTEAQKDVPQPSIEVSLLVRSTSMRANYWQATEDHVREDSFQEQVQRDDAAPDHTGPQKDGSQQPQNQQNTQMQGSGQQWPTINGTGQGTNGGGFGFDGLNNGFPNMAFANPGDFSLMMQFMPSNAMGGFPNMMGQCFVENSS